MIGFRVDANEKIATGHLMRCIAIAKACEKRGEQVLFFLAEKKETKRLEALGFSYIVMETDWQDMEGEVGCLLSQIEKYSVNWLVVDSYQVTKKYLEILEKSVKVLYVDDYGRECFEVSAVLNYNPWVIERGVSDLYQGRKTQLLLGGDYIPLREEFSGISEGEREQAVLITTGGTDTYNIAGKILSECLGKELWQEICFHVIVGSMNEHQEELQALAEKHPSVFLHKNISNISDYMRRCRVAVSAGGTTLYELCACGIPTVCFSFADNQKWGTEAMGEQDVMIYRGDARTEENLAANIAESVLDLMENREKREEYAGRMRQLVDGKGAWRIADFLFQGKEAHKGDM